MLILGVDLGVTGGLALVRGADLLTVWDMPSEPKGGSAKVKNRVACAVLAQQLREVRAEFEDDYVAVMEAVNAGTGQGVAGVFSFGDTAGAVRGVLQALGFRVEYVTPGKWKKAMRLSSDKAEARRLAMERWPSRAADFARVKDHNRAEAALIAAYGWETFA